MIATRMKLVLCFLFGLCSAVTATRQLEVEFVPQGGTNYAHAGLVRVYIDGAWGTICASDWDMNDAEVVCKEMGKGYANTVTVTGDLPSGSGPECLSSVRCYGHESLLSECEFTKRTRSSSTNDKGIVCYPPASEAGLRLSWGPDQYSGWVEVKLASGSWSRLYYDGSYVRHVKPASICRQLGFGELNWWEVWTGSSSYSMTQVQNCAYGIADHRTCTYSSRSLNWQAFVGCHKPGHMNCSAPFLPKHATVHNDFRMNYNFGDRVTVTCDANDDVFILQCHNKGLWSGPDVLCPEPLIEGHWNCSPPYVSKHATIRDVRLSYNFGDRVTVTCDANDDSFALQCHNNGLWNGSVVSCPEPTLPSHAFCSAPAVPPDSTIQNLRLSYKDGDTLNVTCKNGPDWFDLTCRGGIWSGQNIVCPDPALECNPPIIPVVSSIENVKPRYKIGDEVNVTCNDDSDWFVWECRRDGLWRGMAVQCSMNVLPSAAQKHLSTGRLAQSTKEQNGRDYFITGLLVTAVILFILVLMCISVFFIFLRNRSHNFTFSTSSKDTLQDEKGDRGPLPDVPEGYANYIVGDQSLYVEPYLKQNGGDQPQSYEVYEKPV